MISRPFAMRRALAYLLTAARAAVYCTMAVGLLWPTSLRGQQYDPPRPASNYENSLRRGVSRSNQRVQPQVQSNPHIRSARRPEREIPVPVLPSAAAPNQQNLPPSATQHGSPSAGPQQPGPQQPNPQQPRLQKPGPQATAEQAAKSSAPPIGGPAGESGMTLEVVRQHLKNVEEAKNLDEAAKAKLVERYRKAEESLTNAAKNLAKAVAAKAEIDAAPQRVAQVREHLAQPLAKADPQFAADTTVAQLEQALSLAESQLKEARETIAKRQAEAESYTGRKAALPKLEGETKTRLEGVRKELAGGAAEGETAAAQLARRIELEARRIHLESELELLKTEGLRQAALVELTPLEDDLAARRLKLSEKMVAAWEQVVSRRRAEESRRQAQEARRKAADAHPALRQLAERNAELAERLPVVALAIKNASAQRKKRDSRQLSLREDFDGIQEQVKVAGLTATIDLHLRNRKEQLPDPHELRQELQEIAGEVARHQIEKIQIKQEREQLVDLDEQVKQIIGKLDLSDQQQLSPAYIEEMARDLLQSKQTYLTNLQNDLNTYLKDLGELELSIRKLIALSQEYANYISEHVLWIRSDKMLAAGDFSQARRGLVSLGGWKHWAKAAMVFADSCRRRLGGTFVLAALCASLFLLRSRIRSRLTRLGEAADEAAGLRFRVTLEALLHTILVASLWPGLMWLVGWRLLDTQEAAPFSTALSAGLMRTASVFWIVALLREICRTKGIAQAHFGWNTQTLLRLRRYTAWLMILGLPLTLAASMIDGYHPSGEMNALGRMVFICGMFVLAVFLQRILRPLKAEGRRQENAVSLWSSVRFVRPWLAATAPTAFAVLAIVGFYYTAQQLSSRLEATSWLVLGLIFANGLVLRGVLVARYKLAVRRARRQRTESEESHDADVDIAEASAQMLKLMRGVALVVFALGAAMIWMDVLPALKMLHRVELWSRIEQVAETVNLPEGGTSVETHDQQVPTTLGHLLLSLTILAATIMAGKNLPGLLEMTVLQKLPLDRGGRHAVTTIFRYLLTLLGGVLAFRVIGIGWASVQWLAAAMTVGLGFGLQEIFANFVSGLIILFERPIRVGDVVTVSDITGNVSKIRIRATTIVDYDRRELIVPNKKFITDNVINWTLSDPISRVVIPIGVAYGSDTTLAHSILMKTACEHPLILRDPEPTALFKGFGESSLDFDLRFFIPNRDVYIAVVHEINSAIDRAFREAKIEIAFPQRDINIRALGSLNSVGVDITKETDGQQRASAA